MKSSAYLTIGQLASLLGAPEWRVRRVVDSLEYDIPRAGLYRLVPRELIPAVAESLSAITLKELAR